MGISQTQEEQANNRPWQIARSFSTPVVSAIPYTFALNRIHRRFPARNAT